MSALPDSLRQPTQQVLRGLPPLPSAIRYYDDFQEKFHSIRDLALTDDWPISTDGDTRWLRFDSVDTLFRPLLKHVTLDWFTRFDPTSVAIVGPQLLEQVRADHGALVTASLSMTAPKFREHWLNELRPSYTSDLVKAVKAYLDSLCRLSIGPWHAGLEAFVSAMLPGHYRDPYRVVRTGDCFVPLDQQSLVIDFLDELRTLVERSPEQVDDDRLRDACVLLVIYQYAFRPGQVARIKTADVRVHNTGAVHIAVRLTKKRDSKERRHVTRRVKREWCPLIIEFVRRRSLWKTVRAGVPPDSLFGLKPHGVGVSVKTLIEKITSEEWTATDLRHTAAQRLVDAGASHISLAEFMGHSEIRTGMVYFDTSPTQAQRVNQALAISPVYSAVAEVARTRTISKAKLLGLPEDQQIGGAPHGIPIAGIGGCGVGQSMCAKNPVLSCYTCRKFMPVKDAAIHQQVVDEMRPVVLEFTKASRGDMESPAYVQLRRMLTAAQQIAADIETGRTAE